MSAQTVLIADDDAKIRELLELYLTKEGFAVEQAADGAEAILKAQQLKPDLIVLDVMMPVLDGMEVCRQVRKFSRVPVIMLTARVEDDDRILGLELGADDYVGKPFNPRELVARVKAVLRRVQVAEAPAAGNDVLKFPNLLINRQEYAATAGGNTVQLTAKEMDLLWHMASHPGRVFSREQLLESVWGYEYFGDTRTVDTHIKRIRHKLGVQEDGPWDIKTVWGIGYKFEVRS
ncbi:MAG: response regulator transcription factor [Veillonellaceae bacterium]|nr:response regulator transcription factor [Veillonellaceae bacterium]